VVTAFALAPLLVGEEGTWPPIWVAPLARYGPLLLGVLAGALVLRALLRQHRYVARSVLGEQDQAALRAALAQAEARTEGEIVPVVVERSDRHPDARWLVALGALLLGTALLGPVLPWHAPALLLACQVALGAAGWLLAWLLPDLARSVVSESRATHVAEEQAVQEFRRQGLDRTRHATGVLLFVSLFERRVIVLGDAGIHARVGDAHWTATTEAVLDGLAAGSLRAGLLAGIACCGEVLAEHFPSRPDDRNELSDRLVVRRE
jgi:putative membrane protein